MLDVIAIGPLLELHMLVLNAFPRSGETEPARYEPVMIGCDAPIVSGQLALQHHGVRLLSNPIGGTGSELLMRWLDRYGVETVEPARAAPPCRLVGIEVAGTRQRTWLPPDKIGAPEPELLSALPSRYLYLDWYPEVRAWFSSNTLRRIVEGRMLWMNLATQLDESVWPAWEGCAPDLVQISARITHDDAVVLAKKIMHRTHARHAVVTLGEQGSILAMADQPEPSIVRLAGMGGSTTGAGAVFIGSLLGARLDGMTWRNAHLRASDDAGAFASAARPSDLSIEIGVE